MNTCAASADDNLGDDVLTGMIWKCECGHVKRTNWPAKAAEKVCPLCLAQMRGKIIEPGYGTEHHCDVRCEMAKGHTCNCSCRGENHGAAYA